MDLLFINPEYFMETYFDFPLWKFLLLFFALFLFLRIRKYGLFYSIPLSLSISLILSVTLLGEHRGIDSGLRANLIHNLQAAINEKNPHIIRSMLSNVLLFIPYGLVYSYNHRARYVLLVGLLLTDGIEISQFAFGLGVFETSDIACNLIGCCIGAGSMKLFLRWMVEKRHDHPVQ